MCDVFLSLSEPKILLVLYIFLDFLWPVRPFSIPASSCSGFTGAAAPPSFARVSWGLPWTGLSSFKQITYQLSVGSASPACPGGMWLLWVLWGGSDVQSCIPVWWFSQTTLIKRLLMEPISLQPSPRLSAYRCCTDLLMFMNVFNCFWSRCHPVCRCGFNGDAQQSNKSHSFELLNVAGGIKRCWWKEKQWENK